ncbi:hypothetical protein IG389_10495 [Idiomarina abyssalis]|jgi:hypothetical protein|uniref:Uncharacterized protein n=1 Tax=Idiomarina abyssalis TaxID=86102 RepID=A0A8I1KGQ4_9GAMM|nr:hypothetical protein [Idiomarina abyssalis]MBJ7266467.1 hypothetical protein [Idiomarina abyssalis]MBJ7274345.1 hypothetical protein [Idiomarina abyssalis]MBJ7315918.1 hypothetical protein [Idiomarina abyssalis]
MNNLKEAFNYYSEAHQASKEYFSLVAENGFGDSASLVEPWYLFYELSLGIFNSLMAEIMEIREDVNALQPPSLEKLNKLLEIGVSNLQNVLEDLEHSDRSDESDVIFMVQLLHAIGFNFTAIEQRHRTINEMLEVVRLDNEHSERALLEAVYTDRTTLACPTIQKKIMMAQFAEDNSFMDKLTKAVTRTKPARNERAYEPLRYMLEVMAETMIKNKVSTKELAEACESLGLFTDGKDPIAAIAKFNQKRNKVKKESKS